MACTSVAWRRGHAALYALGSLLGILPLDRSLAQEGPAIYINEVLPHNGTVPPEDIDCGLPDMIELYNASDEEVVLGEQANEDSYYLSDTETFDFDPETRFPTAWRFPAGRSVIQPKGHLLIFCDENLTQGACELHATFRISFTGSEPITLWGPEDPETSERPIVDQVWLPPMRRNVSFGRLPDGAGPRPVPIEDTLSTFKFFDLESDTPPTFGGCARRSQQTQLCQNLGGEDRICGVTTQEGGEEISPANGQHASGSNLEPLVDRQTTPDTNNSPAAFEDVEFTVRVDDDKDPIPGNIAAVEIVYRVDGGMEERVPMVYDSATGILDGSEARWPQPLERWTLWTGAIPGQPAGSRVEFHFYVRDAEGLESTNPRPLCPEGTGPCERQFGGLFGGPDCQKDVEDATCFDDDDGGGRDERGDGNGEGRGGCGAAGIIGERYTECDAWSTYAVGYEPGAALANVVINEVVPRQDGILADMTGEDCRISDECPEFYGDCCPPSDPDCCKKREDFIELYNNSDETVMLEGCWLSDRFFRPQVWQFPQGSKILPREHLIVWLDQDGGRCPDPDRAEPPCFWYCPDPTDPSAQQYHTNFGLDARRDQIFLFDTQENNFGVIHGLDFRIQDFGPIDAANVWFALLPDGDREGCFASIENPTPGAANEGDCPGASFKRGDANADCAVDITDPVFTLNWLFLGGRGPTCLDAADSNDDGSVEITDPVCTLSWLFRGGAAPPDPGPDDNPGPDPTDDDSLPECIYDCRF